VINDFRLLFKRKREKINCKINKFFFGKIFWKRSNFFKKEEENNKDLIIYPHFRDFIWWDREENSNVHNLQQGLKFKILIGSCEILAFSTCKEFQQFLNTIVGTLEDNYKLKAFELSSEYKELKQYLKNINISLEDITKIVELDVIESKFKLKGLSKEHILICSFINERFGFQAVIYFMYVYLQNLHDFISFLNDSPYEILLDKSIDYMFIDLSQFFISRNQLLQFVLNSMPSVEDCEWLIETDFYNEKNEIVENKTYLFLFLENLNVFINGIITFPNKWVKRESLFMKIFNIYFIIRINIKNFILKSKIKLSDYYFSIKLLKKIGYNLFFLIIYLIFQVLNIYFNILDFIIIYYYYLFIIS
jgi:hypothetical protein